jgi:hypothetical protein
MPKESGIAKSIGDQNKDDMKKPDNLLYNYLNSGIKISKKEAGYLETHNSEKIFTHNKQSCDKCKFNLPAEQICHIVEGYVNNETGISKYFSPKGYGMLPGDIVWDYVKKGGKKLNFKTAYVINEASEGFNCRDCKYYGDLCNCLLVDGTLSPKMSCAFIVKKGNGTKI